VTDFGTLVRQYIASNNLSQKEFSKRVNLDPALISKILSGKRPPNFRHDELWCTVLGLVGRDAENFKDAMAVAACPPRAQALISRLKKLKLKSSERI
jgi:transcriptional regulator with XRE-family HTH domain